MTMIEVLQLERDKLNIRLDEIDSELRSKAEHYLIEEVKNLKHEFPESNFVFGFEELADMFVIQVNDLTTYHDPKFRTRMYEIIPAFRKVFKGEVLIFITPTDGTPIETPIFKI